MDINFKVILKLNLYNAIALTTEYCAGVSIDVDHQQRQRLLGPLLPLRVTCGDNVSIFQAQRQREQGHSQFPASEGITSHHTRVVLLSFVPARLRVSQNRASGQAHAGCTVMPDVPYAAELPGVSCAGQMPRRRATR